RGGRARARRRRRRPAASSHRYDRSMDGRAAIGVRPCWIQWQRRARQARQARRTWELRGHRALGPWKFASFSSLAGPVTVPYVLAGLTDPFGPPILRASRLDGAV